MRRVAAVGPAERHAAVAAAVEQDPHVAVLVANDDDRVTAHFPQHIVAWLRYLTLMGQELPATAEDPRHLEIEQLPVGPARSVDLPGAFFDCGHWTPSFL
jgi:hypothetical protein